MISEYAKAIVYIALSAVTFLVTALSDNRLDVSEVLNLVIVVLGAVGVYLVPNLEKGLGAYLKGIIAFLTAGIIALLSFLSDGVSLSEWMQVLIAALAAIGVVIVPNMKAAVVTPVNMTVQTHPAPHRKAAPKGGTGDSGASKV